MKVMLGWMIFAQFWVVWMEINRRVFEDYAGAGFEEVFVSPPGFYFL